MSRKVEAGHEEVGRIEPTGNTRPHQSGTFGVIKGETANSKGSMEWSHFCEGALYKTKWFAYRHGPKRDTGGVTSSPDLTTELLKPFNTRKEAIDYLERTKSFDEKF